jgi:hypothetical protein
MAISAILRPALDESRVDVMSRQRVTKVEGLRGFLFLPWVMARMSLLRFGVEEI